MGYKTILVHLDRGARSAQRLELAFGLAGRFDAHLVGLFALSAFYVPSSARADAGAQIIEMQHRFRAEAARDAEAVFRAATTRNTGVKAEWRTSGQDALEVVRLSARYSDLVIIGQRERGAEEDAGLAPEYVEEVVLSAGRPVLLIPYAGRFAGIGKRVLVAWNGAREAARAVSDALPLLAGADLVKVIVFDPKERPSRHGEIPGADFGLFIARHGVNVTVTQQGCKGEVVGEQILSRAADMDADLIVMGAYGHSRLRELVLGGVTRTILDSMTVPVLMSH